MTRLLAVALGAAFAAPLAAQTVTPFEIVSNPSTACGDGTEAHEVCITLPPGSTTDEVDVFLLFDDTGSFAGNVPAVIAVFNQIVNDLQTALPLVDFAFGVGRFEDYGGPGVDFGFDTVDARPFILNQAIIRTVTPGFNAAINAALANTAPGFGGDLPESAIAEGLYQVATGVGFDGNGNASTLDSGPAGAFATQTAPGVSGDVPDFASYVGVTDGGLGGVGWRNASLRIVILATDVCPIATFDFALGIPALINGTGSDEPPSAFACSSTTPGDNRFGYVSDSLTLGGNTIPGAVAPLGAATIQESIDALNSLGIRVIGLAPGGAPTPSTTRTFSPSTFLSAVARLTGAIDTNTNDPLVFDIAGGAPAIAQAIVDAVNTSVTQPIDITLTADPGCPGLTVTFAPPTHFGVNPGETVCSLATFQGDGTFAGCMFDINFRELGPNAILGTVPVTLVCEQCFMVLGSGPGDELWQSVGGQEHVFPTQLAGIQEHWCITMENGPTFQLPTVAPGGIGGGGSGSGGGMVGFNGFRSARSYQANYLVEQFAVQVVMWNPAVSPSNPERSTQVMNVGVWANGTVVPWASGPSDGMQIQSSVTTNPDGTRWLSFPFTIDGFGGN